MEVRADAAARTGLASDVVENALNHTIIDMSGVYNRAGYAEKKAGDVAGVGGLHRRAGIIGEFGGVSSSVVLVVFSLLGRAVAPWLPFPCIGFLLCSSHYVLFMIIRY